MAEARAEVTWSQVGIIAAATMNAHRESKRDKIWQPKDFMPESLIKKPKPPPGGFEMLKAMFKKKGTKK